MEKYLCGGAVRDHLLHIDSRDRDYVVVGSSFDEMLQLGFKQVGVAFPVFLHPETGEEYALARRERKTAPGYSGFEVEFGSDVTLEEDLFRRDLTINSMAMTDNFQVIDPYGGVKDLEEGVLRHTSEAFADDPLRVLRLARFAARYNFKVAPETMTLGMKLVDSGELDALSPDRVWVEVVKMLSEKSAAAGMKVLRDVGCEKVSHLKMLLDFSAVDFEFADELMSYSMKMYTYTNLGKMSAPDLMKSRAPSNLTFQMMFFAAAMKTYDSFVAGKLSAEDLVKLFDRHRHEVVGGDLKQVMKLVSLYGRGSRTIEFSMLVESSFDAVCKLDLEAFVKTLPPKEIRIRVRELKVKTVARFT